MPQFDGQRALEIAAIRAPDTPFLFVSGTLGEDVDIGAWVPVQAARDVQLWRHMELPDIRVSINVSELQLRRRDFVAQVLKCVESSRVQTNIDTELTEGMLMRGSELSTRTLAQLREAGVGVALDHFGSSSCSLPLFAGLPISVLKIDRAFVQKAGDSKKGIRLVRRTLHRCSPVKHLHWRAMRMTVPPSLLVATRNISL